MSHLRDLTLPQAGGVSVAPGWRSGWLACHHAHVSGQTAQAWFGLLGPLCVRDGGTDVAVPAARQRVLLAALLIRAGHAVSIGELADAVWDGHPPSGARVTLRSYIKRLRQVLGPALGSRIIARDPGYLIEATDAEADLKQFAALCRAGGRASAAGAWQETSDVLTQALELWRGQPLADIRSQVLQRLEVPRLEQLWLQAAEWRTEAELNLGRHVYLVHELQALTAKHPLRERFHAQLMLALYRSGRPAEALAAYRRARGVLVGELGIEPGPELRHLHQRILTGDPDLSAPAGQPQTAVPRQLPAAVRYFTGRTEELEVLSARLDEATGLGRAVVISAIGGTAGIGKTALAVHWAHQVAERFPDGQLYVNLRGYDPGQPMPGADALAGFLCALGVPGKDVPAQEDERAARYRSMLAGRRILVVLDNALSVEQVRPLLPGAPTCAVVVTSRDALTGLMARDGAWRLDLDLLPPADAGGLLRALIGGRVDADPAAAAALAAQCCRLPLALRLAAELVAGRPDVSLAALAGDLADQQRRLDLLEAGGDPRTAVRAVFSWSYRHLGADAARTFRLAALHPGPYLDRYAVAALTATTAEQVRRVMEVLARAHLIQPAGSGRYCMHDLLRAYARELAAAHDSEDERWAALTRLFDHYLHTAAAAMDILFPAERHRRPAIAPPSSLVPPMVHPDAARAWLDAERASLAAVAADTAAHGWPGHTTDLAATLYRYLEVGGHYPEAVAIHGHARRAAHQAGDRAAEATALTSLGLVDMRQGRCQQATGHFERALALFRQAGDRAGEARALTNVGNVAARRGRYHQAAAHFRRAIALFRETGDRTGEAYALGNLGDVDRRQGRLQQAAGNLQQALVLFRETGDRTGEANAIGNLGCVDERLGRLQQASGNLQQALALFRETGDRTGEAYALTSLGAVDLRQSRCQQACGSLQQALAMFREFGDRSGQAEALNGLGEVLLANGGPGQARTQHATALGLASQTDDQDQQARAHNGLGHCYNAAGDPGQARRHWRKALTMYTNLGAPEADQVRAQLTRADTHDRQLQ